MTCTHSVLGYNFSYFYLIYHNPYRHFHIFRVMLLYGIIHYSHWYIMSFDHGIIKAALDNIVEKRWKCKLGRNVGRGDCEGRRHSGNGEYLIG